MFSNQIANSLPEVQSSPNMPLRRRLSDKIFIAFEHACDTGELEVAQQLILVVEEMFTRRPKSSPGSQEEY